MKKETEPKIDKPITIEEEMKTLLGDMQKGAVKAKEEIETAGKEQAAANRASMDAAIEESGKKLKDLSAKLEKFKPKINLPTEEPLKSEITEGAEKEAIAGKSIEEIKKEMTEDLAAELILDFKKETSLTPATGAEETETEKGEPAAGAREEGETPTEETPKTESMVPEEFEGMKYEEEKKKYDPLRSFLHEKGIDPEQFDFTYRVIEKIEKDPSDTDNPEKTSIFEKNFTNYHDCLKFQKGLTEEQKKEFSRTWIGKNKNVHEPIEIFAVSFWKKLNDKKSEFYQYRDEIDDICGRIHNEKLEDEYVKAVERGEIKEKKPEGEPKKGGKEIDQIVIEHFGKFNLSEKDLEKIEGFKNLSKGQQFLVLENFKQITLGRIEEEALKKEKGVLREKGFWGKAGYGIARSYNLAQLKKASKEEILKSGTEQHKEILKQLTKGLKEANLEVVFEKGKLEVNYINRNEIDSEQGKKIIDEFNRAGSRFREMPYEWGLATASGTEKRKYKEIKNEFEKNKEKLLLELTREKIENLPEEEAEKQSLIQILEAEKSIQLDQFLNSHPEVGEKIKNIESEWTWYKGLGHIATGQGIPFGAGFIWRSAAISALGALGLPLAVLSYGAIRADFRARKTLKERERLSRKGEIIKTKDVETGKMVKEKEAKDFVSVENLTEKFNKLFEKIEIAQKKEEAEKEKGLTEEYEKLLAGTKIAQGEIKEEIKGEEKEKLEEELTEKEKLLESLKARIYYTQEKIEQGLVNFGGQEKRLKNQYDLMKTLGKAIVAVGINQNEITERLESFLTFKEKKRKKEEGWFINKQRLKGASISGAFFIAGILAREGIEKTGISGKIEDHFKEKEIKIPHFHELEKYFVNLKGLIRGHTDHTGDGTHFVGGEMHPVEQTGQAGTGTAGMAEHEMGTEMPSQLQEELTKVANEKIAELDKVFDKVNASDGIDQKEMWYLWQTAEHGHGEAAEKAREFLHMLNIKDTEGFEEQLTETLSTIHKGEGIENTLTRQLEHSPEKFECPQDIMDKGHASIHEWAGGEAHRIAIHEEYVRVLPSGEMQETRVFYDPDEKTQYILNADKTITEVGTKGMEYDYTRHIGEHHVGTEEEPRAPEIIKTTGTEQFAGTETIETEPPAPEKIISPEEYVPVPETIHEAGTSGIDHGTETTTSEYHGTETTGAEYVPAPEIIHGTETAHGTETTGIETARQIDAALTRKVEDMGMGIEKQTSPWWWPSKGKGNWDFYKEQNVGNFLKLDAQGKWQNPEDFPWHRAEGNPTESNFRNELTIRIVGNGLDTSDKHLSIFEYLKKILKK
ncbi:hypothetical protein KKA09_03305 [Patescibacteria group bacterium]|nr:hypothetical protein [Patescibacteria group bacterium]